MARRLLTALRMASSTEVVSRTSDAEERRGTKLIDATRPFAGEIRRTSVALVASSVGLAALFAGVAAWATWWPLRLFGAIAEGLLVVRLFIAYHDFMHGSLLRGSRAALWFFYGFGVLIMVPPRIWRESHNYHHAHTAKIVGSGIGSFPMVTTEIWKKMSRSQRLAYKVTRHPLTILFGYVPVFMVGMCIMSFVRSPSKYWDSAVAIVVNWGLTAVLVSTFGWSALAFGLLIPLGVACALGGYLFYAQHNFPSVTVQPRQSWSYVDAALHSSSYIPMGALMRWITGNIGFHHVHHLNPSIPFYRLPEAMRAIPELQHPGTTTLRPRHIAESFSLNLWDAGQRKMVAYPQ